MAHIASRAGDFEDHAGRIRSGEELDLARLEPYMRSHFSDLTGALRLEQFPSGHST